MGPHLLLLEHTQTQESLNREKSQVATRANHHQALWAQALTAMMPSQVAVTFLLQSHTQAKPAFQAPLHSPLAGSENRLPREPLGSSFCLPNHQRECLRQEDPQNYQVGWGLESLFFGEETMVETVSLLQPHSLHYPVSSRTFLAS